MGYKLINLVISGAVVKIKCKFPCEDNVNTLRRLYTVFHLARGVIVLVQDAKKDTLINMRVHSSTRDFIDRAAKSVGKGRSDFMLDAVCEKAQDILVTLSLAACVH